jgi:hypothetical protein
MPGSAAPRTATSTADANPAPTPMGGLPRPMPCGPRGPPITIRMPCSLQPLPRAGRDGNAQVGRGTEQAVP